MPDIDEHLGRVLRHRRKMLGLTQLQLAETIGVRFQQVHKYESGANRMSASRLFQLANALKLPVKEFFAGLET